MAQKKQPFDHVLSAKAVAGSNDVEMDPVESGCLVCVQHLGVENKTTDFTSFRVMKAGVGGEFPLEEQLDPEGGELYWMNDNIYFTEGQYPLVRFVGCTANDVLKVYITGWKKEGVELNG